MGSVTLLCAKHHSAFYFLDHEMGLSKSGSEITGTCPNSSLSCCNWFFITSCTAVDNTTHHHQHFYQDRICYDFLLSYVLLYLRFPFFIFAILPHFLSPPLSAQWVFICQLNPLKPSGYFYVPPDLTFRNSPNSISLFYMDLRTNINFSISWIKLPRHKVFPCRKWSPAETWIRIMINI